MCLRVVVGMSCVVCDVLCGACYGVLRRAMVSSTMVLLCHVPCVVLCLDVFGGAVLCCCGLLQRVVWCTVCMCVCVCVRVCVVLCCVVLCCVVALRCAVLCYAVLLYVVLCCAGLCSVMLLQCVAWCMVFVSMSLSALVYLCLSGNLCFCLCFLAHTYAYVKACERGWQHACKHLHICLTCWCVYVCMCP